MAFDPQQSPEMQRRVRERAHRLWREAGSPAGREDEFLGRAQELVAIEERQRDTLKPNPETHPGVEGPWGEPVEPLKAAENQGEFPTLTDQGEEETRPHRSHRADPADDRSGGRR